MDNQAKQILRRSLDHYNEAEPEAKKQLRKIVQEKLDNSNKAADLIGFSSAESFTTAAKVFLRIVN